jgi:hypothetical protein
VFYARVSVQPNPTPHTTRDLVPCGIVHRRATASADILRATYSPVPGRIAPTPSPAPPLRQVVEPLPTGRVVYWYDGPDMVNVELLPAAPHTGNV